MESPSCWPPNRFNNRDGRFSVPGTDGVDHSEQHGQGHDEKRLPWIVCHVRVVKTCGQRMLDVALQQEELAEQAAERVQDHDPQSMSEHSSRSIPSVWDARISDPAKLD